MMPKDPVMLLSYVNTQLRDFYPSLAEFCAAMQTEESDLREKLAQNGRWMLFIHRLIMAVRWI